MQENQTTIEGTTLALPQPFLVLATQNPVEQEGVYRLPEAQLDRFLLRIEMSYPGADHEVNMLKLHSKPAVHVQQFFTPELILQLQELLRAFSAPMSCFVILSPCLRPAGSMRRCCSVPVRALPCAFCVAQSGSSVLDGRDYFTHEDVQAVALGVLGHRLILRPEAEVEGKTVKDVVADLLRAVPVLKTVHP